jgi:hypothetical protein
MQSSAALATSQAALEEPHGTENAEALPLPSVEAESSGDADTAEQRHPSFSTDRSAQIYKVHEPPTLRPTHHLQALQMYEGTVLEVRADEFVAKLRDQRDPSEPLQGATISFAHISDADRKLVAPGAVFYWTIGYRVEVHGQRSLTSTIRFRRLPAWSPGDIENGRRTADALSAFFAEI